jgi:hypothetical protein
MMKRILFVCDVKYPEIWKDGLWAALQVLRKDYEIDTLNLHETKETEFSGYEFILGWGAFGSPVDNFLQGVGKVQPIPLGLCIGGTATAPHGADIYSVLFHETYWHLGFLGNVGGTTHRIHAFGINGAIYNTGSRGMPNLQEEASNRGWIHQTQLPDPLQELPEEWGATNEPSQSPKQETGRSTGAISGILGGDEPARQEELRTASPTGNGKSDGNGTTESGSSEISGTTCSRVTTIIDVLSVGSYSLWKRHDRLAKRTGVRLTIGEIQRENLAESYRIIDGLLKSGVGVMDMIQPEELAKFYKASKLVYIPAEIHGGGERAVLEARACGTPVEVESDNPKLLELTKSPIWDHNYYAEQLKRGIELSIG